jgi:hypothetical protein
LTFRRETWFVIRELSILWITNNQEDVGGRICKFTANNAGHRPYKLTLS